MIASKVCPNFRADSLSSHCAAQYYRGCVYANKQPPICTSIKSTHSKTVADPNQDLQNDVLPFVMRVPGDMIKTLPVVALLIETNP